MMAELPVEVHHHSEWFFYLFGAFLMLAIKWWRWVYRGYQQGKSMKQSTIEWFSLELLEDKISWATTVGVVWVFGAVYIDRVGFLWIEWIRAVPIENSISFLFGSIMEYVAPNVVKWIVNKMPV